MRGLLVAALSGYPRIRQILPTVGAKRTVVPPEVGSAWMESALEASLGGFGEMALGGIGFWPPNPTRRGTYA